MNTPYYTKAETDAIEANLRRQYNYGASEFQGYLLKTDIPTLDGWYWATEIGTYTNAGNLVTVANKINMIEKSGITYKLYAIDVPAFSQTDALLATKEDTGNKQNNLTVDGTGTKFPTVDAVNSGLVNVITANSKSAIDVVKSLFSNNIFPRSSSSWSQGTVVSPGVNSRIYTTTPNLIDISNTDKLVIQNKDAALLSISVQYYNASQVLVLDTGWLTLKDMVSLQTFPSSYKYVGFSLRFTDNRVVAPSNIGLFSLINIYNLQISNDFYVTGGDFLMTKIIEQSTANSIASTDYYKMSGIDLVNNPEYFEQGGLDPLGLNTTSTIRIRTKGFLKFSQNIKISLGLNTQYVLCTYSKDKVFETNSGWVSIDGTITIDPTKFYKFAFNKSNLTIVPNDIVNFTITYSNTILDRLVPELIKDNSLTANIKVINHRGYNLEAPENTLPAYILSKKKGFNYIECDVQFTSDNIPVLLHDIDINRTSTGTGNIASLTYATVRTYDFGVKKNVKYTGTLIPSFEEFIFLCKTYNLHAFVEVKMAITDAQALILFNIVKKYGMLRNVTWMNGYLLIPGDYTSSALTKIKNLDSRASLSWVEGVITDANVAYAVSLKNDFNKVYINVDWEMLSNLAVQKCIDNNLDLLVWTVDSGVNSLITTYPYISGITTNYLNVAKELEI